MLITALYLILPVGQGELRNKVGSETLAEHGTLLSIADTLNHRPYSNFQK